MERRRILGSEAESMINEEFELVATANITEETKSVEIQLSKACTELYLFCKNLKSTANSQLIIAIGTANNLNGINGELSTNAQNTIQHIKKVGKTWIRTGNNHGAYGLDTASTQMYRMSIIPNKFTLENISKMTLCLLNDFRFTSGTIEIYGR